MSLKIVLVFLFLNLTVFCAARYQGRIVNGSDAGEAEFPFIASLRRASTGRHSCGASLLNRAWALTAAHCVARALPSMLNVQFGSTVLRPNSTDNLANVSRIFVHEGYEPQNKFIHDIALLKLAHSVTFNSQVQAVKLPEAYQPTLGNTPACLIGWGLNATGGRVQKQLQKVSLQIFSDDECSDRHQTQIHTTNICAGVPEGGKGQCSGDSGGPLLVNGTQVGIVSWSRKPCAIAPYPGVFTEVSAYVDWILKTMDQDDSMEQNEINDGEDESLKQLMTGNLIVSLRKSSDGTHFCAGTIIDPQWILTAAHCFTYIKKAHQLFVQFGSSSLNPQNPRKCRVTDIVRHEGYNPTIIIHDIALLQLEKPLDFSRNVKMVKLPNTMPKSEENEWKSGQRVKLLGWGLNETFGTLQEILQQVDLELIDLVTCRRRLNAFLHASNLCAVGGDQKEGVRGQCSGDSGGPLMLPRDTQIGIVSWSLKPCAFTPGVFTKVAVYGEWIQQKIGHFGEMNFYKTQN